MMMLSLLENPSATERLRAVGYTKNLNDANGRVIDALLTTLNNDPNVNVRLVTLEALAELAHDPRAREGLVQSLTKQESPLVFSVPHPAFTMLVAGSRRLVVPVPAVVARRATP